MTIIFLIFASILLADLLMSAMYGWIAHPKLFCLRGFKFGMFFEMYFWLIMSLALYSWIDGPQYFQKDSDVIVSIGTWDIYTCWLDEGLVPLFSGYVFYQPVVIYIPKNMG